MKIIEINHADRRLLLAHCLGCEWCISAAMVMIYDTQTSAELIILVSMMIMLDHCPA